MKLLGGPRATLLRFHCLARLRATSGSLPIHWLIRTVFWVPCRPATPSEEDGLAAEGLAVDGTTTPISSRLCDFKMLSDHRCDNAWQACIPVLDQVSVDCGNYQLEQLGQQWCLHHARMVMGKVCAGPRAKRSKDWECMVAAGRFAVHRLHYHEQYRREAATAADQARVEADRSQHGNRMRAELGATRALLLQAGTRYEDLAIREAEARGAASEEIDEADRDLADQAQEIEELNSSFHEVTRINDTAGVQLGVERDRLAAFEAALRHEQEIAQANRQDVLVQQARPDEALTAATAFGRIQGLLRQATYWTLDVSYVKGSMKTL